jgi:hypothetical protein
MILAWTAALAIYLAAAIALSLAAIALASVAAPPGRLRTAIQIILALLGLIVAVLLTRS